MKVFSEQTVQNSNSTKLRTKKKSLSSSEQKTISSSSFEDMLEKVIPIQNETTKDIHLLWKELPAIEKAFIAKPNNENLKIYREYISSIIQLTLQENVKIKSISFRKRDDEQTFKIIKVINQELHLLNHIIIKKENAAFNLMRKLENIKGLLLDIKQ